MSGLGKILMTIGGILLVIGFLMQFTNFGKLPGDIVIRKGNFTFYFPIATSIILSIILTLIFYFLGKLK
ncbi:MAG: DUF2905 domain-containing protein [Caldibacillus sp.]